MEKDSKDYQRLDKWLKTVRLFKTRRMASDACDSRLVKVNDVTSKPSKLVKVNDEITIRKRGKYLVYKVVAISHRSISAKIARELYEEITPNILSPEEEELLTLNKKLTKAQRPKYPGKPAKKDRRNLMKLKYGDSF